MFLDEMEVKTIQGWIDFLRNSPLLLQPNTENLTSGTSFSLTNYNVLESSIILDNSMSLVSYLPYDQDMHQISAIIVSGTSSNFNISYQYSPFAVLTRNFKKTGDSYYKTPKLFALWMNSVSLPYRRQVNNAGKLVGRRRVYMNLLLDVEGSSVGYIEGTRLLNQVMAAVEGSRDTLYSYGFEDIVVEEVPDPNFQINENPFAMFRGLLMVAFTIYPEIKR